MPRGGYRQPNNPAPVSGPGALSQRTDGGPAQPARYISGLPYGQGQETYDQQTAAPMAGTTSTPAPSLAGLQLPEVTPLMAPTSRPNESITSGIDLGVGPTSAALNLPSDQPTLLSVLRNIAQYDPTGDSEMIYRMLEDRGY